jgi:hypothetical protein
MPSSSQPLLPVVSCGDEARSARASMVLGWPKRCKLAHAFLWEYSCKRLKMAQLLGQLGVFLTGRPSSQGNFHQVSLSFNAKWAGSETL